MAMAVMDIEGSRDLTLFESLKDQWAKIEPAKLADVVSQALNIAAGRAPRKGKKILSERSQMIAMRIVGGFMAQNVALARLELDAWRAQQPGELSTHNIANVVDKISEIARAQFGDGELSNEFRRQLLTEVLHAARLEQGTSILPGDVDDAVLGMDETIPDEPDPTE